MSLLAIVITIIINFHAAGDARTVAMVKERGDEDAIFDNFADPAGLIMQKMISDNVPRSFEGAEALYKRARALKLPHNPLV